MSIGRFVWGLSKRRGSFSDCKVSITRNDLHKPGPVMNIIQLGSCSEMSMVSVDCRGAISTV